MKRYFSLLLLIFIFSLRLDAQKLWTHTWGGNQTDGANSVVIDQNRNYIIAGYTNSFGVGTTNVLVQKYDNSGNLIWSKTWGGNNSDAANAVAVDKNNNIYIVGSTSSFGNGGYDILILKFDSNGSLIWSKTWGGNSYDVGYGISIDSDDNLFISAESYSYGSAAILLKFDNNGNFIWGKSWKSSATFDASYSLTIDYIGNVILTGISWDYSVSPNVNKILAIKYDKDGNFQWSRIWGGSGLDEAWGSRVIKTDKVGNIYIAGRTQFGNGSMDALLLKLDINGNLIWSKNWGGKDYETNSGIDIDDQGNIYTVGYSKSFTNNYYSLFILKYDTSGKILSNRIWDNKNTSQGNAFFINKDKIIIAGQAYNASGNWQDVNGTTGEPSNSLLIPAYNLSNLTDVSKNISGTITSPGGTKDSGGGSADVLLMKASISIQSPFLTFPLKDKTPYTATINSVFDHSMTKPYSANQIVVAYTGEKGKAIYGKDYVITINGNALYGFKNSDSSNFNINGHYSGGGSPSYLYYDGHPGYDYKTIDQSADGKINVLAAASGIAHIVQNSIYNTIYINHGNGYSTYYLHLSQRLVTEGAFVNQGDVIGISGDAGVSGNPHLHFEVKYNGVPVDPYGWHGNSTDPYTTLTGVVNSNLWLINPPSNNTTIMDELNGSTLGIATGITYQKALSGLGAVFNRTKDSRISYPFSYGIPKEGTLEWWVNVQSGYWYDNYTLYDNQSSAQLFGTDAHGGDVNWPGAMKLMVSNDGKVRLEFGNAYGQPDYHELIANTSPFTFGQWHSIGISYGSEGQYIKVDGILVASDTNYFQQLGSAGNFSAPIDTPSIGQTISGFWGHNQYDGGFNGIVDRFRASSKQQDWILSISSITSVTDKVVNTPNSFNLFQNYPNPFNPTTTIQYDIPKSAYLTLKVYNITGQVVATLVNERKSAGSYSVNFNASGLTSGIYFYRIQAGSFVQTKKMILLK